MLPQSTRSLNDAEIDSSHDSACKIYRIQIFSAGLRCNRSVNSYRSYLRTQIRLAPHKSIIYIIPAHHLNADSIRDQGLTLHALSIIVVEVEAHLGPVEIIAAITKVKISKSKP